MTGVPNPKNPFRPAVAPIDFLLRNTAPRGEIVGGLIREGQVVAFAGPYGVGKSPVLLDLTIHVLNGIDWCGHQVQKRPVIAFDFESDAAGYKASIRNICRRLGLSTPKVPEDFDVYLEHDLADEPATAMLLAVIGAKNIDPRLTLIEEALGKKPNALVIIDPVELLFRVDVRDKMHVLGLYSVLRRLLSKYPTASMILTFNLRKRDRRSKSTPDLLLDARGWLEEVCGSLDLLNRSDVRLGLDFHNEEVRVINGIRRGEPMEPTLIHPVADASDNLAGFELSIPGAIDLQKAFTQSQKHYWETLASSFRFEQVADVIVPRSSLSRLLRRAQSLGLVKECDGVWSKANAGTR
jgi:hypothetical protein